MDVVIALSQCPYLDVNWQDSEGNTALITAAQAGKSYVYIYYCFHRNGHRNISDTGLDIHTHRRLQVGSQYILTHAHTDTNTHSRTNDDTDEHTDKHKKHVCTSCTQAF